MRRLVLAILALLLAASGAVASLPAMTPCAPPASGTAYPVDPNTGYPIPGADSIPFHLAYVCVPPCLIWDSGTCERLLTGNVLDTSTYSTTIESPPVTILHFFEDEWGHVWVKRTVIENDPPAQTDSWYRVVSTP